MFDLLLWTWIVSAAFNIVYIMLVFHREPARNDGSDEWFVALALLLGPIATVLILSGIIKKKD